MKGLKLSEKFYKEFGEPMLKEQFASVLPYLAVGLCGSGSECMGFDDALSRDHDFEPAFCIFIPDEDVLDSKTVFELERAYGKLPREFEGFKRNYLTVGEKRHGVIKIGDFYKAKTGRDDGVLTLGDWLSIPEYSLKEATNGQVFFDNYGLFTSIREKLSYYPEEIRLKKLAGHLLLMGQAGQYNYKRCVLRNDSAAAQMAMFEFVKNALNVIFLLNKTYMPYYKWAFYALKDLEILGDLSEPLEYLISSGNDEKSANKKVQLIEDICAHIAAAINSEVITKTSGGQMEALAYCVNNTIKDGNLRNLHILSAV